MARPARGGVFVVRSTEAVTVGRPRKSGMSSVRGAAALATVAGLLVTFGGPASASATSLRAPTARARARVVQ